MAPEISENLRLGRPIGKLDLTPVPLRKFGVSDIRTYKGFEAGIEGKQNGLSGIHRLSSGDVPSYFDDSRIASPVFGVETSDYSECSSSLRESRPDSPPTSTASDSDDEETRRTSRCGRIRIPSPPLVDLGIHVPLCKRSGREDCAHATNPLSYLGSVDECVTSHTGSAGVQGRSRSCSISAHIKQSSSSLDFSRREDEGFVSECDSNNSDDHLESDTDPRYEPATHLSYSERQLALFGDFLRSPFSDAAPTQGIGIGPLDTEVHVGCDCDMCLLVDVALTREFSEPHPIALYHRD